MLNCLQCGMDVPGMEWPGQKCTGCHQYPLERTEYSTPGKAESSEAYHERAMLYASEMKLIHQKCGTCGEQVTGHSDSHWVT